jgi:hypothetical protein
MNKAEAESTIFDLRKKADMSLFANDVEGFNRVQQRIIHLQQEHGALTGAERIPNDRETV